MMRYAAIALTFVLVACSGAQPPDPDEPSNTAGIVIYPAALVVPMTGDDQRAEAVAVQQGRILALGTLSELSAAFPAATTDDVFADKVILPGLIDPHMHVLLGAMMYGQPFAAPWPMAGPDGMRPGYPTRETFLQRVAELVAVAPPDGSPIVIYGYHNLVQGTLNRDDLDAINDQRPIIVWHYSGHDFYLNSPALDMVGADPSWADTWHGIGLTAEGRLNGRIYEDAALQIFSQLAGVLMSPDAMSRGLGSYFDILRNSGVTTTAELGYGIFGRAYEDAAITTYWGSPEASGFHLYLVPEYRALGRDFGDGGPAAVADMVAGDIAVPAPVLPRVKFFTDGAFYSQTMRLSPPGYLAGQSEGTSGLWVMPPDQRLQILEPYADAGFAVHIHSNGDAAQDATLDALQSLRESGFDEDFVIEHGGLFSPQQVDRAADLGASVSVASHYVFYMAPNYADPLGPARARWISPVNSLTRAGVAVALHSDAPLAPPIPLRAAGAHVTRLTRLGGSYMPDEALTPYDALESITLDAARVLGLDDEIGSLDVGKRADFTVLEANPLETDPEAWATIGVWGVLLDGVVRPRHEVVEAP